MLLAYVLTYLPGSLPGGFLIPVAVFMIISIPPVSTILMKINPDWRVQSLQALWPRDCCNSCGPRLGTGDWFRYYRRRNVDRWNYRLSVSYMWSTVSVPTEMLTCTLSVFRYLFRTSGANIEKQKVQYAALARIIREGGIVIAVVVRYSVVPNHCELNFIWCNLQD